jgi:hypothetical protein
VPRCPPPPRPTAIAAPMSFTSSRSIAFSSRSWGSPVLRRPRRITTKPRVQRSSRREP